MRRDSGQQIGKSRPLLLTKQLSCANLIEVRSGRLRVRGKSIHPHLVDETKLLPDHANRRRKLSNWVSIMGPSTGTAFDRLRLEAKCLLKDIRRGDQAAIQRFTPYWPATGSSDKTWNLARAQLVIARERGYRSWTHLKTSLLGNEERIMSGQKNTVVPERRLGVYTYEEAESLLGIPSDQLRKLVEQIEKKPRRYLDAILLEKVWVTAKPFIVTLKRNDGQTVTRENSGIIQDAILAAGGILAMDMAQWRFASLAEAERAASLQAPLPEHTWIVMELGFEKTMEHLKTVWSDLIQRFY